MLFIVAMYAKGEDGMGRGGGRLAREEREERTPSIMRRAATRQLHVIESDDMHFGST